MSSDLLNKYSINKEGYLTVGLSALLSLVFFIFSSLLGLFGVFCTLLMVYFFRDPKRVVPLDDDLILSPADGIVCNIENSMPPPTMEINEEMLKISIFLSPLNVHVNRIPIDGVIKKLYYKPGKSLRADYDNSENENERQEILLEAKNGKKIVVTQQTGFLTRRIVCNLNNDQEVKAGKRFGIIKFGSRATIYLPKDISVFVNKNQTVIGGETILASFSDTLQPIKEHLID